MPWRLRRGVALSIPFALIAAAFAMALIGFPAFGAPATPRAHASSSGKAYTTTITYVETDHGRLQGNTTTGIQGHGTFSAKLSPHAALAAALIAAATGIPLPQIVKGGSYTIEHSDNGTGVAVVTFNARGLGKLCVSYTATAGKFVPGDAWIPVSGTLKALGGTGTAATWSGSVTFNQTALSGTSVQRYGFSGQARGSVGKARGLSTTCKHVAAIKG